MVSRLIHLLIVTAVVVAVAAPALAANTLTIEPDRMTLYQGEVLTLTVKGTAKIDLDIGNLFDSDMSTLPKPDIEKVEDEFEILSRNQQYSIRTLNSEMFGEIIWTYQLVPKTTGKLTIPAFSFRDARSRPLTIEVIAGSGPDQTAKGPRDSFIELSADKDEVYVQEQLLLTVRLFFTGNLIQGELSEPDHPDAIIESLGKQSEYTRYRDGLRYRVVERQYAVFPQQQGQLNLPPIRFEGQARGNDGRLRFLRDDARLFDVPVRGVPAGFSGDTWLPARSLELDDSGLPQNQKLTVGQNLTRTLSLRAVGLPAETLPPFPDAMPEGIRAYPEIPERTTTPGEEGLTSRLTQTAALVPVKAGKIVLPEIRIPWWNTDTDTEQVAVMPARTFTVEAAPGQAAPPASSPTSRADADSQNRETAPETPPPVTGDTGFWPLAALVLLAAWLATLAAWWYSRRRRQGEPAVVNPRDIREKALFRELCEAARTGSPGTSVLLVEWMAAKHPEQGLRTLVDVNRFLQDRELAAEMEQLQQRLFGAPEQRAATAWSGDRLVTALIRLRSSSGAGGATPILPPLYPDGLRTD